MAFPAGVGFQSEEQQRAFEAARSRFGFGGPEQHICGARTRAGGICRMPPMRGERRCLTHAGPHAARRFRDAQIEALGQGELSWEVFQAHERRRAANKLQRLWKTAPWAPGATIDLGGHEARFLDDMRLGGFDAAALAPAVVDKARWRWRRLRLDRDCFDDWMVFLTTELPVRIGRAGPRPAHTAAGTQTAIEALFSIEGKLSPTSKRRRLDPPRRPAAAPKPRGRRRAAAIDDNRLSALWREHGPVLARLAGDAADEQTLRWLAALLAAHLDAPDDVAAAEAWRNAVAECRPSAG